jgi:hypothetical protein
MGAIQLPIIEHEIFVHEKNEELQSELDNLFICASMVGFSFKEGTRHNGKSKKCEFTFKTDNKWLFALRLYYDNDGYFDHLILMPYGGGEIMVKKIKNHLLGVSDLQINREVNGTLIQANTVSVALKLIQAVRYSI